MASRSSTVTPLAVLFLAGSLAMLWFVVLSGETGASPLRQTYFLRADTSGIRGARAVTQWTYLRVCGEGNEGCGPARPALPLGDAWASGAGEAGEAGEDGEDGGRGVPAGLAGEHGGGTTGTHFWYMWRFGWVFYLLALFFETVAFFTGALACLSTRLAATLSGFVALVALVFLTTAVSLMTATFVKMRNAFVSDGRDASLGAYGFGFSWGAWAALLVSTVLFCMAQRKSSDSAANWGRGKRRSGAGRVKDEYP